MFYINLPVGILCAVGLMILIKNKASDTPRPFDLLGFALLAIAIGTFQLMLDRGEQIDWFGSSEIIIEAAVAGIAAAMFVIHMLIERPSVPAARPVPRPQPDARASSSPPSPAC